MIKFIFGTLKGAILFWGTIIAFLATGPIGAIVIAVILFRLLW